MHADESATLTSIIGNLSHFQYTVLGCVKEIGAVHQDQREEGRFNLTNVDEPQLNYQGFTLVTYLTNPRIPLSPSTYLHNYLCKWVNIIGK
jgi:hypothetical protein